jgi:hypothetical protein
MFDLGYSLLSAPLPPMNRRHRPIPFIFLTALMLLAGCDRGPQIVPLKGKVTYNGEPLKFGGVMLQPVGGQPATGTIEPDGSFVLSTNKLGDGATVGMNRIRVTCFEGQAPGAAGGEETERALGNSLIPRRYNDIDTSGLTVDVMPSGNEDLLLELTDDVD